MVLTDTHTSMLPGVPGSAICVQRFDDSLNSAIRITYRISLRSSSLREPRYPSLKVVFIIQRIDAEQKKREREEKLTLSFPFPSVSE